MNHQCVFMIIIKPKLANRFQKRQAFDVTNRASDLDNNDIRIGFLAHIDNFLINGIGDVGNYLYSSSQIVAPSFLLNHLVINLTGRGIIIPRHIYIQESFVMPQIQIGFRPVIRYVHFPVLIGTHRARVHINVRV